MIDCLPAVTEEQLKKFTPGIFKPSDKNFQIVSSYNPSLSGKYSLLISNPIGEGWKICRGVIVDDKDNIIVDIIRTYGNFPFAWFIGCRDRDCILVSEEYYGTWVYCPLTSPRPFVSGSQYGYAFCPYKFIISPDNKYMVVPGCHWGGPYEYRVFNLETISAGYLSCISVGDVDLFAGESETIEWQSDKVIINTNIELEDDNDNTIVKRYRYAVPLLKPSTVEQVV